MTFVAWKLPLLASCTAAAVLAGACMHAGPAVTMNDAGAGGTRAPTRTTPGPARASCPRCR